MTVATGHPFGVLRGPKVQVMAGDELVTTTEAARRLGIAARTLQRYVAKG